MAVAPLRPETATGVVAHGPSLQLSGPVDEPLPSSPKLLSPQQSTAPPENSAQAW
jgi:hypothetical protein